MNLSQRTLGYIIAALGVLVALVAFFSLPYITQIGFPVVGAPPSQTTVRIVTYTLAQHPFGNWLSLSAGILALAFLLVVRQIVRNRGMRGSRIPGTKLLIVLAALVLLGLIADYLNTLPTRVAYYDYTHTTFASGGSTSAAGSFAYYLGPGFWLYATGIVLVIVGGMIAARSGSYAYAQQESVA